MSRTPDFIIIGAMKCATSTLHDQLAAQTGFFMTDPKEPNFFSDEEQWARGMRWYEGLFAGATEGQICGESSTHYSKLPRHPKVVERIAEHLPNTKFVYIMRQPVDRLVSHYIHEWTQRVYEVPIAEAVDRYPELRDFGNYAMQLEPYLDTFGRDRVLPVFFDQIRTDPQAVLERVCKFVGYTGEPQWQQELGQRNASAQRMRRSPLRDFVVNAPLLTWVRRNFVPQSVRDRIKSLWRMEERPTLADADRRRLEGEFDPSLAKLGGWLGIDDLCCANFVERTRDTVWDWTAANDG